MSPANPARGSLFVISAPSGAGKSTLVARLVQAVPGLRFSVSYTTRPPRPGEVDGVHYRFVDEAAFRAKVPRGEFLEWAEVHGRLYGTGRAETVAALNDGLDLLLDIDVQGAALIRVSGLEAESIFILPPGVEQLEQRLSLRGTEDRATLERRLANACAEVARWQEFDYVVVNDDLDEATADLCAIVRAARARSARRAARAAAIAAGFEAAGRRPEAR